MKAIFKKIAVRIYWKLHPVASYLVNSAAKRGIPLTRNNRKIRKLKDQHRGERCFIVGNGPSLRPEDLDRLKDEITFASNKTYKIFGKTSWRPTYYMAVDDVVVKQNFTDINAMQAPTKFTLHYLRPFLKADIYFNNNLDKKHKTVFSENLMYSLYSSGSVSFHMLQIAFHMGFTEVYLIGHDHNYKDVVTLEEGESAARENRNSKMYFCDDYVADTEAPAATAADEIVQGMEKAKIVYEADGRKIYNASRVSFLDVFDKVDFEDFVKARKAQECTNNPV